MRPRSALDCANKVEALLSESSAYASGFAIGSARVGFVTPDTLLAEQVTGYMRPYIKLEEGAGSADWTVLAARAEKAHEISHSGGKEIVISGRGRSAITGHLLSPDGEELAIYNRNSENYIVKRPSQRRIIIIGDGHRELYPGYLSWLGSDVNNAIRQVLRTELENQGALVVHGATAQVQGRGVAFIGDKQAGKTTNLLTLLLHRDARFIGNDRFFLVRGDGFHITGWPTTCRIRTGTLSFLSELPGLITRVCPEVPIAGASEGRVTLVPQQISSLFPTLNGEQARLAVLVFPRYEASRRFRLTRFSRREAVQVIRRNLFTPNDKLHPNWLQLERRNSLLARWARRQMVAELVSSTPCYRLEGSGSAEEMLECLDATLR